MTSNKKEVIDNALILEVIKGYNQEKLKIADEGSVFSINRVCEIDKILEKITKMVFPVITNVNANPEKKLTEMDYKDESNNPF